MTRKITGWEAAQALTLEGFLKWCEGKLLSHEDFKPVDRVEGKGKHETGTAI